MVRHGLEGLDNGRCKDLGLGIYRKSYLSQHFYSLILHGPLLWLDFAETGLLSDFPFSFSFHCPWDLQFETFASVT